jgi:hypothetical protein
MMNDKIKEMTAAGWTTSVPVQVAVAAGPPSGTHSSKVLVATFMRRVKDEPLPAGEFTTGRTRGTMSS